MTHSVLMRLSSLGTCCGPGVIGAQALPDGGGGDAADGEFLGAVQEVAAVDVAVDVPVEQVEQFLREVRGFFAFHLLPVPSQWFELLGRRIARPHRGRP